MALALSLAKAAPLKPEIKLAQALSEFEAVLPDDQKTKLRTYRGQSPPNPTDVMRFTAEIDRDAGRTRKSRQCVGPRLTNVLHAVQQFSSVVDLIVGSSQSQIAGAVWGAVKISLQCASAVSSYFDQLSQLFMRIGRTCPRNQDFGVLYPESTRLQCALCEYFVVIVRLCKQAVLFLKKPFWSQLSSSIMKPFESEFSSFQQDLENLASAIRDEVSLASNQAQQNEAKEMSKFRLFAKNISDTSTQDIVDARTWKRKKAEIRFLNACSVYNPEKSWKQARKQGSTNWICHDGGYKQWKQEKVSGTLWCTGILGSGKTVLAANVVEDLKITTHTAVAYFFCRHDEAISLETRTIIGSIARQIFDHVRSDIKSDIMDRMLEMIHGTLDTNQILGYLQDLLPSDSQKCFIIIDGLDECEEKETRLVLQCLKQLLMSKHVFQIYCASRPDVFYWAQTVLEPKWTVSMSQTGADIEEYVKDTLINHLESESLSVGNHTTILTIQDALLKQAHGMFLWVAFQIDSICSQKTDKAILKTLEDLPKDLPKTFSRVLLKLQHSNAADPQFCKKIFDLLAAAQRPLTLEELREAVSVEPGETSWDASKLVNDMLRSLLDSCGSLVVVDEEHLTVHFAHHSVKQYLLSEPTDPDLTKYHVKMKEANSHLGDIIVTYLNFGVFDRQLTFGKVPQAKNYPSAILIGSLPRSNIANKLAVRLLKNRGNSKIDIGRQLSSAAGVVGGSKEQTQVAHPFLHYAQRHWLFHTEEVHLTKVAGIYNLWRKLVDEEIKTVELPWAPEKWDICGDKYMRWIIQNEHWSLIDLTLLKFAKVFNPSPDAKLLLDFLERKAIEINVLNIPVENAFYLASLLGIERVMLLFLRKGANINAKLEPFGTALQVASVTGRREIVEFLLENGADVNVESRGFGTALQVASALGHEDIARLLLKHGADVNSESTYFGSALQTASENSYEEIVKLLLDNGVNINAEGGAYGSALQAASESGREKIVRLLLDNGANINAEGGLFGSALQVASAGGHEKIVRLLLDNGAIANNMTMKMASIFGNKKVQKLIRSALMWDSSPVPDDPKSSPGEESSRTPR